MFTFKLYRANRAVHHLARKVTHSAYQAGLYDLSNRSTSWIPAHVEQIAQRFEEPRGTSMTLREQITTLEDQLAKAKVAAEARQAQIDLVPPRISPWATTVRVLALFGATYLVGTALAYGLGVDLSIEIWLSLAIAAALAGGPWAMGIPVLSRRRAQQVARRAARQVRQQEQELSRLTRRIESLRHREAFIATWTRRQIDALQQIYTVACDAACKAREYERQLTTVLPPTISFDDMPNPLSPAPHAYAMDGTLTDHPFDLLQTGRTK